MLKTFKFSNDASSRFLQNGNFSPNLSHPHAAHLIGYCEEVQVFFKDILYDALLNTTATDTICCKGGYNTRANGWCDDLEIKPGELIIRTSSGSASCFAGYRVFNSEDAE